MQKIVNFSFIIPVYNCEKYLNKCVDSIINQNHDDIEIILVDDGSTDKSASICEEYKNNHKFISAIHKKNEGVSKARNTGLKKAKGKYICFLDSDDYLEINYIDKINDILNNNKNIELINFGFYSDVNDASDIINYNEKLYSNKKEIIEDIVNLWDSSMFYNIWNKVYLKDIIDKYKLEFPTFNYGEDIYFNELYFDKINVFYNCESSFYHYIREREGSITKEYKDGLFETRKDEYYKFNEYFESIGLNKEDYISFSSKRFIDRLFGCIENEFNLKKKFQDRYKKIKSMIYDDLTKELLKYYVPNSKKTKLMIIPIKLRLTIICILMGRILNIVKSKFPNIFNKLKNRR